MLQNEVILLYKIVTKKNENENDNENENEKSKYKQIKKKFRAVLILHFWYFRQSFYNFHK